jgi:hypothetical protein
MADAKPLTRQPVKTRYQLPGVLRLSPAAIRRDIASVDGFNAKFAVLLTKVIGTMWTFYVFNGIAFISLPSAVNSGNLTVLINWVSSNWIQLVLLPALMVGQNLESATADLRAEKTFEATEKILDRLDTHTAGGLRDVLDAVEGLKR